MIELRPWDKQPGETTKAYAAFVAFKNIEPAFRSQVRVASDLSKSRQQIQRWSSKWNWEERASAYDETQEVELLASRIEMKKRMDEEHLRIVRHARNKAVQALKDLDPKDLTPSELRHWLDMTLKLERLIMGEPESIQERRKKIVPDYDLEKEMAELQPIIEEMYREGILTDEDPDKEDA